MDDLIEALTIFRKYGNPTSPTHCEHDTLHVCISPDLVSENDLVELLALGFYPEGNGSGLFSSYRFGSA